MQTFDFVNTEVILDIISLLQYVAQLYDYYWKCQLYAH